MSELNKFFYEPQGWRLAIDPQSPQSPQVL